MKSDERKRAQNQLHFQILHRAPPRQSLLQSSWYNAAFHCSWKHQWPVSPVRRRPLSATLCWCVNVFFTVCQTARRVGEWERQTAAEDEGGSSVQATYRHRCTPGPQHLQVSLSACSSQLVRWYTTNKKKNSWIKYLNPFFPAGCSSDRLQRNSTVLSLPANQTSRRIASFSLCLQLYIPLLPLPEDAGRLVTYCQGCLRPPLFSLLGAEFTEGHVGKMLLVLGNITRLKANWQKCNCRHV